MTTSEHCDCVRAHELLNELGTLMIKHKCISLSNQGYSIDEINDMLDQQLVPELKHWMFTILQGFIHDETSAGHTVN
jgi:hypothetical protein